MARAEAKTNLTILISQVEKEEEIIITQDGIPVPKIVLYKESKEPRPLGIDRGKFTIPDDFDAPLPDEIINNKGINCMNNNITYTNQIEHKQLIKPIDKQTLYQHGYYSATRKSKVMHSKVKSITGAGFRDCNCPNLYFDCYIKIIPEISPKT